MTNALKGGVYMSYAQQRIIDLAPRLSDEAASAIVEVMNTFIMVEGKSQKPAVSEKRQAYLRLKNMVGGFPADFDPDKEIAEAKEAKYGTLD